mmetsp:Transcript_12798/g.20701  ORF Transcript_12798/g.20701 Transcript_12798/m.20701 type:complete len:82 (+) Transcript_12798:102-347(+)
MLNKPNILDHAFKPLSLKQLLVNSQKSLYEARKYVGEIALTRMKILRDQLAHAHTTELLQRLSRNSFFQVTLQKKAKQVID